MIGQLPTSLNVNGREYSIRSDFRPCLSCLVAFNDSELTPEEQMTVLLEVIYLEEIPEEDVEEAIKQAIWFLNCGELDEQQQEGIAQVPLYSWEQDEQLIFSGVNKSGWKRNQTA